MKKEVGRRDFIKKVSVGTVGIGAGVTLLGATSDKDRALTEEQKHEMFMKGTVDFMGFRANEITPNKDFYITSYSDKVPQIDPKTFQLSVGGNVEKPYTLTLDELAAMKDKTEFVTLECIGNPVGGSAIGNALWDGVTLRKVIEKASPKSGLVKTVFYAEDGYTDSIPYELSLSDDVFLAFKMNEKDLPPIHGYPVRAIVPGIYGMKNVKWLSKIELVDYDFKGYWEKRGWSDEAVISVMSEILMPMDEKTIPLAEYVIGGVAFGGRHGIGKVEISTDDGEKWQEAATKKPLSKWSWVLWSYRWMPPKEDDYTLKVRAYDLAGKMQETGSIFRRITGSFPSGAKGIHSVNVTVKKA
jgi:DMSO/TMAO reductase YedYZ molybdopterin-dependent catalytic subunit